MKFNIANPSNGAMKCIEVDDEKKLAHFYDKRMGQEVDGEVLGDEFRGFVFRVSGGNDKEGFPMMQGVLVNERVRILLKKGMPCYRPRKEGERKKKSVRGCIVGPDISVLQLIVVKPGDEVVEGLTDEASERPRRLGPKRANNIRKLFNLTPDQDVRKFVIGREFVRKGKTVVKRPKIQRLLTPVVLQRKRRRLAVKKQARDKAQAEAAAYKQLLEQRKQERRESIAKRKSSRKSSRKA